MKVLKGILGWIAWYRESWKNREVPYNLVKRVNAFFDEMKSIGYVKFEANDDEELDDNDSGLKVNEYQNQWFTVIYGSKCK